MGSFIIQSLTQMIKVTSVISQKFFGLLPKCWHPAVQFPNAIKDVCRSCHDNEVTACVWRKMRCMYACIAVLFLYYYVTN